MSVHGSVAHFCVVLSNTPLLIPPCLSAYLIKGTLAAFRFSQLRKSILYPFIVSDIKMSTRKRLR